MSLSSINTANIINKIPKVNNFQVILKNLF